MISSPTSTKTVKAIPGAGPRHQPIDHAALNIAIPAEIASASKRRGDASFRASPRTMKPRLVSGGLAAKASSRNSGPSMASDDGRRPRIGENRKGGHGRLAHDQGFQTAEKAAHRGDLRSFRRAVPEPRTELAYQRLTLLVSVVLSAQATDNRSIWPPRSSSVASTPARDGGAGEAGLIPFIASIGLFRTKAKHVVALSRLILEQHGGEVPPERGALQPFPASAARPPAWFLTSSASSRPSRSTPTSSASPIAWGSPRARPRTCRSRSDARRPA